MEDIVERLNQFSREDGSIYHLAATEITALRERVEALLPFTSHTAGCAIYFRSWAMGEPPCTCGLDATRALGEQP